MTKPEGLEACGLRSEKELIRFYELLFRKLVKDLIEAYQRTPIHVSSRPYIERALNLAMAGYDLARCTSIAYAGRTREKRAIDAHSD